MRGERSKDVSKSFITVLYPQSFASHNYGIAYGIYAIALFLVFAGFYIALQQPVFNQFLSIFNNFVGQGMVSQQTADNMSFIKNAFIALPIFILFATIAWVWIRALEKRQRGG